MATPSSAPLSPEEARTALDLIEQTAREVRRRTAHGGMPYFFIIWGWVWLLGFTANALLSPEARGWVWLSLDVAGLAATYYVVLRISRRVRWRLGPLMFWFWAVWLGYAGLFAWLLPVQGHSLALFLTLYFMQAYVVMGLLLYRSAFLIALGLVVSGLTLLGYLLFPGIFNLWMAVFGGGTMIAVGVYMLYAWR